MMDSSHTIQLNGAALTIDPGETIASLLQKLALDPRQVAVERNREIVPRAHYGETRLERADAIEIVTFVGGG